MTDPTAPVTPRTEAGRPCPHGFTSDCENCWFLRTHEHRFDLFAPDDAVCHADECTVTRGRAIEYEKGRADGREAGSTEALRAALERGYLIADDLDSNHARWVIQKLADEAGITFNLPPVNEPNNRLREQLSEARAALARLSRESDR
jgi:hypothetical protein